MIVIFIFYLDINNDDISLQEPVSSNVANTGQLFRTSLLKLKVSGMESI